LLSRDLLAAARYYVSGRRALIVIAVIALAGGLWLGWPALVAAGVAPILIALAPCAVMCALGLCMGHMGKSGSAKADRPGLTGTPNHLRASDDRETSDAGCCGDAIEHVASSPTAAKLPHIKQEKKL
jgi:hypothetical protein